MHVRLNACVLQGPIKESRLLAARICGVVYVLLKDGVDKVEVFGTPCVCECVSTHTSLMTMRAQHD